MTLKILSFTIAVMWLFLFGVSAHAKVIEAHDMWAMTCFPNDGPAFFVAASGSNSALAIKGRGPIRVNHILTARPEGDGFTILARGTDYHGNSRTLQVHFGPQSGFLDVIDRGSPAIMCGPDHPLSND